MELFQTVKSYWDFINSKDKLSSFEFRRMSKKHTANITEVIMNNGAVLTLILLCIGAVLAFLLQTSFSIVADYKELREFFNILTQGERQYNLVFIGLLIFLFMMLRSIYKIRENAFWERNSLNSPKYHKDSIFLRTIKTLFYFVIYMLCLYVAFLTFNVAKTDLVFNNIMYFVFAVFILLLSLAFYFSGIKATGLIFNKQISYPPLAIFSMKREPPGWQIFLTTVIIAVIELLFLVVNSEFTLINLDSQIRIALGLLSMFFAYFYLSWFLILHFYQFDDPRGLNKGYECKQTSNKQHVPKTNPPRFYLYKDILLIGFVILFIMIGFNIEVYMITHEEPVKSLIVDFVQNRTFDTGQMFPNAELLS